MSEMPMTERIQDRIAKLLAKAEGTSNASEAEVFFKKASELMAKWQIEEVKRRDPDTLNVEKMVFHLSGADRWNKVVIMEFINRLVAVYPTLMLSYSRYDNSVYWLWGDSEDADRFDMLLNSLLTQCWIIMEAALEESGQRRELSSHGVFVWKRSFVIGFAVGAASAIHDSMTIEAETEGALVLVNRTEDRIRSFMKNEGIVFSKRRRSVNHDYDSYNRGYNEGRSADLNLNSKIRQGTIAQIGV